MESDEDSYAYKRETGDNYFDLPLSIGVELIVVLRGNISIMQGRANDMLRYLSLDPQAARMVSVFLNHPPRKIPLACVAKSIGKASHRRVTNVEEGYPFSRRLSRDQAALRELDGDCHIGAASGRETTMRSLPYPMPIDASRSFSIRAA